MATKGFAKIIKTVYIALMSFWSILSWISVLTLTGINIFVFLKIKKTMEDLLKNMFPQAKGLDEALGQLNSMMQVFGKFSHTIPGFSMGNTNNVNATPQNLQAALSMLSKMQGKK